MQYKYRKLKGRIKELYGTQKAFSKKVGLSANSVSMKLTGKCGFSQSDIELWSKFLKIERENFGEYFFT